MRLPSMDASEAFAAVVTCWPAGPAGWRGEPLVATRVFLVVLNICKLIYIVDAVAPALHLSGGWFAVSEEFFGFLARPRAEKNGELGEGRPDFGGRKPGGEALG